MNLKKLDKKTFDVIFNKYYEDIFRYIISISKNYDFTLEIIQKFFVKMPDIFSSFDKRKCNFKSYLFVCARNETLNFLNKNYIDSKRNLHIDQVDNFSYEISNEFILFDMELLLTNAEFECLYLEFYQNFKKQEINKIMGISDSTRNRLRKSAIKKLKDAREDKNNEKIY